MKQLAKKTFKLYDSTISKINITIKVTPNATNLCQIWLIILSLGG